MKNYRLKMWLHNLIVPLLCTLVVAAGDTCQENDIDCQVEDSPQIKDDSATESVDPDGEFKLTVIVLTMDRPHSLARLLRLVSVQSLIYVVRTARDTSKYE